MGETEVWNEVDSYVSTLLLGSDSGLTDALRASESLPHIQVSAPLGKFLQILAKAVGARRVLEVGTLGGYSAIWMARALPEGGRLITLEVNEEHARVARSNLERAGLGDVVDVRIGPALAALDQLHREGAEPFDLVFIDADKPPTAEYFDWAVRLSHPGSVIVVDNVVREGKVVDANLDDDAVRGMRRFMDALSRDSRVTATVIQTVGSKGYDGFALAFVL
jgi:predicted O-methyltransferase YrrM